MAKYKVRWKGKELGEFSKCEIEDSLRSSKMGFLHQVLVDENWVGLKTFLESYTEEVPKEKQNDRLLSIAYFSTGLAFLSPYLVIVSLAFALYLYINNAKQSAVWISSIAGFIMLLGIAFFRIIEYLKV